MRINVDITMLMFYKNKITTDIMHLYVDNV